MKWQGKKGLIWFTGVVEDRDDPLFLNRVRVRIYGVHTWRKDKIATPDLPWSQVLMPTTSPSLSGLGITTHGLVEGSTVMGFWRDSLEMQDPVIMGSFIGQPTKYSRKLIGPAGGETEIGRNPNEGFNDPRRSTVGSYTGTPDGIKPKHMSNRTYGLTLALDKSPRDGYGSQSNYPKGITTDTPANRSYIDESDVNKLARPENPYGFYDTTIWPNDFIEGTAEVKAVKPVAKVEVGDDILWGTLVDGKYLLSVDEQLLATKDPEDKALLTSGTLAGTFKRTATAEDVVDAVSQVLAEPAVGGLGKTLFSAKGLKSGDDENRSKWVKPIYPFNHVYESESGHVIEIDDTPDAERINLFHRSGARIEINNVGEIHMIAGEGQDINLQGHNFNVQAKKSSPGGEVNINAAAAVNINAAAECTIKAEADTTIVSKGKTKLTAFKELAITALKDVALKSVKKVKIQ